MENILDNLNLLKKTKENIRNAIEYKGVNIDDSDTFISYANKIYQISSVSPKLQEKSVEITENGASAVSPDNGYDGLSEVSINVAVPIPQLQSKDYSIVTNGDTVISPDSGFDGISGGTISVSVPIPTYTSQSKNYNITSNGDTVITVDEGYDGITGGTISVAVPTPSPKLQEKSVSISQNGQSSVTADTGYDGLSKVDINVNVPSSGSGKIQLGKIVKVLNNDITEVNDSYDFSYVTKSTDFGNGSKTIIGGGGVYESGTIDTYSAFKKCENLTTFNSSLSNLENGTVFFQGCTLLSSFSSDLLSLTNGRSMFSSCKSLTTFSLDLHNLIDATGMFSYCTSLITFTSDLSNLKPVLTYDNNFFSGCTALENISLSGTLNCDNFNLSYCPKLTEVSLVNVISVLVDLTGQSSKTLKLGSTNLAKLSDEQKAIATNKNWVLS